MRFGVLIVMTWKCNVFWDVTPWSLMPSGLWYCSLVEVLIGGNLLPPSEGWTLWIKAASSSVILALTFQSLCHQNQKNKLSTFHLYFLLSSTCRVTSCAYYRILFLVLFLLSSLVTIFDIRLCYFITDFSQSTSRKVLTAFVVV